MQLPNIATYLRSTDLASRPPLLTAFVNDRTYTYIKGLIRPFGEHPSPV
jgi:hypothetical protein